MAHKEDESVFGSSPALWVGVGGFMETQWWKGGMAGNTFSPTFPWCLDLTGLSQSCRDMCSQKRVAQPLTLFVSLAMG